MKKKELLELMGEVAGMLSRISSSSRAEIDGSKYEIHQLAHGAAIALGMFVSMEKKLSDMDIDDLVHLIIKAAVDWERDNPELMGEGGEDK